MKKPGNWHTLVILGLFLAAAGAPALGDDVLLFDVTDQMRIGSVVLDPGTYALRSSHARQDRNVLTLWSADEGKYLGCVLAHFSPGSRRNGPTDAIVFAGADGKVVKSWSVASKGRSYLFGAAPASPALAGRGNPGSVVAAR